MILQIRRVIKPDEMGILCELDQKIFGNDGFDTPNLWEGLEIYFVISDDNVIGSIAFRHHSDVSESYESDYPYLYNSLYLASIGILPEKQAEGIGSKTMAWLIDYARKCRFSRIVSNARKSNLPSAKLHQKFGFKTIRTISRYYKKPSDDAIVFELKL